MYQLPAISGELTKSQLTIIAESIIDELKESGRSIDMADAICKMEHLIKEIKSSKEYVEMVREHIQLHGGNSITTSSGTRIDLAETGTKYDYSNCNDSILQDLEKQEEFISEKVKERQTFLKTIPYQGMDIIDEYGEVKKIYPPAKSSTSSFKATIKK